MHAARAGCTTIIDHHASPSCCDGSLDQVERAFRDVGLSGCLSYEVSDRNQPGEGIEENERYIRKCQDSDDDQMAALFGYARPADTGHPDPGSLRRNRTLARRRLSRARGRRRNRCDNNNGSLRARRHGSLPRFRHSGTENDFRARRAFRVPRAGPAALNGLHAGQQPGVQYEQRAGCGTDPRYAEARRPGRRRHRRHVIAPDLAGSCHVPAPAHLPPRPDRRFCRGLRHPAEEQPRASATACSANRAACSPRASWPTS